jgi:hypothetical protein
MIETCITITGILLLLAVVAVVVIIVRSSSSHKSSKRSRGRHERFDSCPSCEEQLYVRDEFCPECGLNLFSRTADQLDRVRIARREIRHLKDDGLLDAETADKVSEQLARRRYLLRHPEKKPEREHAPPPLPVEQREVPSQPQPEPVPAGNVDDDVIPPEQVVLEEPPSPSPKREAKGRRPRRSLADVFGQFMHERNILWGELAGGLLIVGCSIALVLSLWRTLESLPYLTFLLAGGITAAIFGAGYYTLHHWNLKSTSRGLLIIALLLTPLNLLLLADPGARGTTDEIDVAVKVLAVLAFAGLVRTGGRDLVGTDTLPGLIPRRWLLGLAIVGAPASQMLPAVWQLPMWLPLGCYFVATGMTIGRLSRYQRQREGAEPLGDRPAVAVLLFVGLGFFALLAAWGFLLSRADNLPATLQHLAVPTVIAAMPVLAAGLLVQRRLAEPVGLRVTGTGVVLTAMVILFAGLVLAWPEPLMLLATSAAIAIVVGWVAYHDRLPWMYAAAIPCAALASVLLFTGAIPEGVDAGSWLSERITTAHSGAVLAAFAWALLIASQDFWRLVRPADSRALAFGAAGVSVVALLFVTIHGVEDPQWAAVTHLACAAGFIAASFRWQYRVVAQVGTWLLLPATLWLLWATVPIEREIWGLVLAGEALSLALAAFALRRFELLSFACRDVAGASAVLGLVLAPFAAEFIRAPIHAGTLFLVAATAFALAALYRQPALTWIGSMTALVAFAHLGGFALELSPWRVAILLALLVHTTLATVAAMLWRAEPRKRPDDEIDIGPLTRLHSPDLFVNPLRYSARLTTCLVVPLLLFPVVGLAGAWAGFALWTSLLLLVPAVAWRERGAFPAFQAVLTWSAVLVGLAWVEAQSWFPGRFGVLDPRALQAYGVAVGILSVAWQITRRALNQFDEVRRLWSEFSPSIDRVVLGLVVVGQLLLAAGGLFPAVVEELTPHGSDPIFVPVGETAHIWAIGAWLLLGLLAVAVGLSLRWFDDMPADAGIIGLLLLVLTVPFLVAGGFAPELAAASALRWGLAAAFLVGSMFIMARNDVGHEFAKLGFRSRLSPWGPTALRVLLALPAGTVLLLTFAVAVVGFGGDVPTGPAAGSIFHEMGWTASAVVPLAAIVLGLAGTTLRERSSGYAFVSGLVLIGTLSGGYALGVVTKGGMLGPPEQVRVALLGCGAAAVWALGWLAIERRVPGDGLLTTNIVMAFVGLAMLCLIPFLLILAAPGEPLSPAAARFGLEGWLVLIPAAIAAYWHARRSPIWRLHTVGLTVTLGGILLASAVKRWDEPGSWLSLHVLAAVWAAAGIGMAIALLRTSGQRLTGAFRLWPELLATGLILLGMRGGWADPWRPWAPAGAVGISAALFGVVALRTRSLLHEYASGLLAMLAGFLMWVAWGPFTFTSMAMSAAIGLAIAGAAWAAIALRRAEPRKGPDDDTLGRLTPRRSPGDFPAFPHFAAILSLGLLLFGIIPTLYGADVDPPSLAWGLVIAVGLVLAVLLRDPDARFAGGGLYVLGVIAIGLAVSGVRGGPIWLDCVAPLALAGYALAASALALTSRAGLWRRGSGELHEWFLVAQGIVAAFVLGMAVRTAVTEADLAVRLTGPLSAILLVLGTALLVRAGSVQSAMALRTAALLLGATTFAMLAWSLPDPHGTVPWLNRHAGLFAALSIVSAVYLGGRAAVASTRGAVWDAALGRVGTVLGALALGVLVILLLQQIPHFDPVVQKTPLDPIAVGCVVIGIAILIVLALCCALRPDRDPLGPTPQGRTAYVYLAEVLLVLLFAHVRLNVPEVFTGQAMRYWTFIVMLLAFIGVGLAELFARRGLHVLSKPLMRTGVMLPLIPLLAFWAKPPGFVMDFADERVPGLGPMLGNLEKLPQHLDAYALLWLLAGLLYGLIALSRRSFGWALLGALATNAGLWALLQHHEVPAAIHPQAWAIPLALIILVSEHVNRHRLRADVAAGLRYLGISMIYIASAADLFIGGVGQSWWLPIVLAALCLGGVVAGVLLRVRAFLYLGIGFLLLDIFAMIWHAAVDQQQTWVWYASGMVLGALIIALFAVLEKRRNDVRELVGKFRQWNQ